MCGEYQPLRTALRASCCPAMAAPLLSIAARARASSCTPRRRSRPRTSPVERRARTRARRGPARRARRARVSQQRDGRVRRALRQGATATCSSSASRAPAARRTSRSATARRSGSRPARCCPTGADAVLQQELVEDRGERITLLDEVAPRAQRPRAGRGPARGRRTCSAPARGSGPADARRRGQRRARERCAARGARASPCWRPATSCGRPARRSARARSTTPTA